MEVVDYKFTFYYFPCNNISTYVTQIFVSLSSWLDKPVYHTTVQSNSWDNSCLVILKLYTTALRSIDFWSVYMPMRTYCMCACFSVHFLCLPNFVIAKSPKSFTLFLHKLNGLELCAYSTTQCATVDIKKDICASVLRVWREFQSSDFSNHFHSYSGHFEMNFS